MIVLFDVSFVVLIDILHSLLQSLIHYYFFQVNGYQKGSIVATYLVSLSG